MKNNNQDSVGKAMEKIKENRKSEELFFDPDSGLLEVSKKGEPVRDRDRLPATKMVREGFFNERIFGTQ